MLCLRAYRVLTAPSGYKRIQQYRIMKKWKNEELADFQFNVLEPKAWRKYLRQEFRNDNGKKLPTKTADGEEIRYEVYFWGTPMYIKEHFDKKGINSGYQCLYPGYDKDGKRLNVIEFGDIR